MTPSTHPVHPVTPTESTTPSASAVLSLDDEEGEPEPSSGRALGHHEESRSSLVKSKEHDEQVLVSQLFNIFTSYAPHDHQVDYRDDCALLSTQGLNGRSPLLLTTDAPCEGVHFDLSWDSTHQVGAQAAIANLSDLASSGANPQALLWSLSIPEDLSSQKVQEIAHGFGHVAGQWSCSVIGGNLCVRPGPLEIHVTAIGSAFTHPLTRLGVRSGDALYVTGTLGDRALGYLDPTSYTRAQRHLWRPHINEAKKLAYWGHVSAMLDISDGLLVDVERLARLNEININIDQERLPLSAFVRDHPLSIQAALSGGEDYVLLFTAPAHISPPPEVHATLIGHCHARRDGFPLLTLDGRACEVEGHLYQLKT